MGTKFQTPQKLSATDAALGIEHWLSPKELAGHFGLKEDSAERWIRKGTVPREYIKFCGRWRYRIHPAIIPVLEADFERAHD